MRSLQIPERKLRRQPSPRECGPVSTWQCRWSRAATAQGYVRRLRIVLSYVGNEWLIADTVTVPVIFKAPLYALPYMEGR